MIRRFEILPLSAFVGCAALSAPTAAQQAIFDPIGAGGSPEPAMLRGDTPATSHGWVATPLFTVSEALGGYQPVGILDGIGAFARSPRSATILVNHELGQNNGYAYQLANGTMLTGARVSSFVVDRRVTPSGSVVVRVRSAEPAYDTVYDRNGDIVTDPAQINETGIGIDGFSRFCSSVAVAAGTYGFVDDVYFTGEETTPPFHPFGGTEWALDVDEGEIWAVPSLGRAAWENVTPLETGDPGTVALLVGDDTAGAPLYLYVGQKDALGDGSFLDRNGLAVGRLHAWRADDGSLSPEDFNGLNEVRTGTFVEVAVQDPASAGLPGYDAQGYLSSDTLQASADALGCFSFSRPEDLATNPLDGSQAAFASTGRGSLFPSDNWGTIYVVDVDVAELTALLVIVHDADDLAEPDAGIRSPDNLDWADDGKVYVQEDRSTSPSSLFGAATGVEASLWSLDPVTRAFARIGEIDRSAVAPAGSTDGDAGDLGSWESSGVLDVTDLFDTGPGERLLILSVQAHGIEDGPIGGNALLDEGGQLLFFSRAGN